MLTPSLQDQDIAMLLNSMSDIHELNEIDLGEWDELRYALANIIGDIRSQFPNAAVTGSSQFRKRIDLEQLLIKKFEDWETRRLENGEGEKTASSLLEFHLSNSGRDTNYFVASSEATSSVLSFRWALDDGTAWKRYEIQLCASTEREIEELSLADMAHSLALS